jgi:transposase-like protein
MNCAHCGSERIIGKGSSIRCKDCGRYSIKIRRLDTVPLEKRPPCPECGAPEPYSLGKEDGERAWRCQSCGRRYKDKPQMKVEIPTMEVQEV